MTRTSHISLLSILSLSGLLIAAPHAALHAQEPDSVPDPRPDSAVALPPVVVTASKLPVPSERLGFSFAAITPRQMELERPFYATDAIRELTGTFVTEAAGPGGPSTVQLRGGEEVFTQILMDGVQINENGGFFDFQGVTLSNMERVEIARGPQSAVYGSSAVSGVVQFVTRRGREGRPRLRFRAEGGGAADNGGTFQGNVELDGGTGVVRYSAGGGASYNRGIFEVAHDTWTAEGSGRLDVLPSDRWELSAIFRQVNVDSNNPVRDPGATRAPLDPNARIERDRSVGTLRAVFRPSERWSQQVRGSVFRQYFLFFDERDDVNDAGSFPFFIFDADFSLDSELWRTTGEYIGSFESRPGADTGVTVTWGAQLEREDLTNETAGDFGDDVQELDRSSVAGFGEVWIAPHPRVSLLLGSRIEKYEELEAELTPRASAVFHAVPGALSLRAAGGRAYKVPNLQEQFLDNPFIASNPDLEPETSVSWEVGADVRLADGRFSGSVTFFDQDFDNLIRSVGQEGTGKQINRNLGESEARGIEWELRVRPSRRWAAGANGVWVETEILDNTGLSDAEFPEGAGLPFRPELMGNVWLELLPTARFSLVTRGTFVGEQTVLTERFSGRREALDAYILWGLTANLDLSPGVGLYARIENLLDTDYQTGFDRRGIPLTAALGFRITN